MNVPQKPGRVEFTVTVIIPVYNNAEYLRQCVESVVGLAEVGEIILVEDASTDDSLKICQELAHGKIKLLRHPDGKNHGVSASRNLGITHAASDFIAFLDSDDYYLPDRFARASTLLTQDPAVDGVYDAAQYENDYRAGNNNLYSIRASADPDELFFQLLQGSNGFFCTDAITLRKSLFDKSGKFREEMRMHEDSELWLRLAYHGKLYAGVVDKPVAVIRQHDHNAIKKRGNDTLRILYNNLMANYTQMPLRKKEAIALLRGFWRARSAGKSHGQRRLVFYIGFFWSRLWARRVFQIKPD